MQRFLILVCASVFGYIGWWLASGFGIMTAFIVSSIASIVGVYVGWRLIRDYLE